MDLGSQSRTKFNRALLGILFAFSLLSHHHIHGLTTSAPSIDKGAAFMGEPSPTTTVPAVPSSAPPSAAPSQPPTAPPQPSTVAPTTPAPTTPVPTTPAPTTDAPTTTPEPTTQAPTTTPPDVSTSSLKVAAAISANYSILSNETSDGNSTNATTTAETTVVDSGKYTLEVQRGEWYCLVCRGVPSEEAVARRVTMRKSKELIHPIVPKKCSIDKCAAGIKSCSKVESAAMLFNRTSGLRTPGPTFVSRFCGDAGFTEPESCSSLKGVDRLSTVCTCNSDPWVCNEGSRPGPSKSLSFVSICAILVYSLFW